MISAYFFTELKIISLKLVQTASMKKEVIDISTAREIEKKIMREENELEKNENESEDGVVGHSREQELESRKIDLSEILSLEGLEGRWKVTTADERVERVGCNLYGEKIRNGGRFVVLA